MKPGRAMWYQMLINVKVTPRTSRDEIVGLKDDVWQIRVKAPPVEGRANDALLQLLGKALKLKASDLAIVRGHTSRRKTVAVSGLSEAEINGRLSSSYGG
ncbi:MAG: YggU family protein [Dehalococcoidia bacterium]|nr:MAG: YggU family protein [Dehalococcoidia bacterium]